MACPYFRPTSPVSWANWHGKLRPPLGEFYGGECTACGDAAFSPAASLLEHCNLGYAAGECANFPKSGGPDAVRFAVSADESGVVRISYSYEQAHLPCRHGVLEYLRASGHWREPDAGSLLQQQAEAYLNSYLRWKESQPAQSATDVEIRLASAAETPPASLGKVRP
jgi:hypothetical protein